MGVELNAKEVFELARQIEKKAEEFYLIAATTARDAVTRGMFMSLAIMEREHAQVFDAMAVTPAPDGAEVFVSSESQSKLWPILAAGMVENIQVELPKFFENRHSTAEILKGAMGFERDTIVLFLGIREMMASPADRTRLDDIMKEEMGHLVTLGSHLARLGSA